MRTIRKGNTVIKMPKNPASVMTLEQGYELFMRKCKVKNLSDASIKSYKQKLKPFLEYLGYDFLLADITSKLVDDFILFIQEDDRKSDITTNGYIRSVRALLYYLMSEGYLSKFKVSCIKATKPLKETYTDDEIELLLSKPDTNRCSFSEYRTWVFECYLLGTGNRIQTALDVKIEDIDFSGRTITLKKTKNRKQQIIPLSQTLAPILEEYLMIREGERTDYLFCNNNGGKGCKRVFQQLVHDYNLNRGVSRTGCHLFRHTFAKNWILAGGDPFRLMQILGHSDLQVTMQYVQMFGQDLQMDFERFNPLDTKMNKKRITMRKGR